jgi:hypothetical protein
VPALLRGWPSRAGSRSEKRWLIGTPSGVTCCGAEQVALHHAQPQRLGTGGGSSSRVVTPAVIWLASDTRSMPENALSEKID